METRGFFSPWPMRRPAREDQTVVTYTPWNKKTSLGAIVVATIQTQKNGFGTEQKPDTSKNSSSSSPHPSSSPSLTITNRTWVNSSRHRKQRSTPWGEYRGISCYIGRPPIIGYRGHGCAICAHCQRKHQAIVQRLSLKTTFQLIGFNLSTKNELFRFSGSTCESSQTLSRSLS